MSREGVASTAEESVSGVPGGAAPPHDGGPHAGLRDPQRPGHRPPRPPAAPEEGAIVVTSLAELTAAKLSAKRLLAIWNALPGVDPRSKAGDRPALLAQLWSVLTALPDPAIPEKGPSKQARVLALLRRPEGVTIEEVVAATGWQRHTVRGLFAGTFRKKRGLAITSAREDRGRVYRLAATAGA